MPYRTDADSDGMDDGTLSGLNEVDRQIRAAAVMGVDITDVVSPERVAQLAKQFALPAGSSVDLTNGWDFNRDDHKRQAWGKVKFNRDGIFSTSIRGQPGPGNSQW